MSYQLSIDDSFAWLVYGGHICCQSFSSMPHAMGIDGEVGRKHDVFSATHRRDDGDTHRCLPDSMTSNLGERVSPMLLSIAELGR